MKIFSGSSNFVLANKICHELSIPLGNIFLKQFASGEHYCQYKDNLRGDDVFLIQSTAVPANDNLMELLIMADAARRASAGKITAILPYFGYSRQDRKDKSRTPISSKLVMDLIQAAGFDRIITMDLHAPQIGGFTNLPFDQLQFKPTFISYLKNNNIDVDVVVSPDIGAVKRSQGYAETLQKDLAIIAKKRVSDTKVEVVNFIGDVTNKRVLIVDDLTETLGTLKQAAKTCWKNGASEVNAAVTHPCFSVDGIHTLSKSLKDKTFTRFFHSDTTTFDWVLNHYSNDLDFSGLQHPNLICVSVAPVFATAIRRIHNNESVSELFDIQ